MAYQHLAQGLRDLVKSKLKLNKNVNLYILNK